MRHLPEITGMRGLAAFAVLLLHVVVIYSWANPAVPRVPGFEFGWVGVDFFFVLSGFLLALPLLQRPEGIRAPGFWATYMAKRWWRIAPPYYVSILLALLLAGDLQYLVREPADVALHLTYLHSVRADTLVTIVPVYWTLASEFQFYLLLPLFAYLFTRRSWPVTLALLGAVTLAWRAATFHGPGGPSWMSFTLPAFLLHFSFGILAARAFLAGWRLPGRGAIAVPLVFGVFVLGPILWLGAPGSYSQGDTSLLSNVLMRPLLGFGFAALIFTVCSGASVYRRAAASTPMRALGESSYSLYLTHVPIMLLLGRWAPIVEAGFWTFLVAAVSLSIAGGALFYLFIEKPSLALRGWFVDRATRKPRVPTGQAPMAERAPRSFAATGSMARAEPTA